MPRRSLLLIAVIVIILASLGSFALIKNRKTAKLRSDHTPSGTFQNPENSDAFAELVDANTKLSAPSSCEETDVTHCEKKISPPDIYYDGVTMYRKDDQKPLGYRGVITHIVLSKKEITIQRGNSSRVLLLKEVDVLYMLDFSNVNPVESLSHITLADLKIGDNLTYNLPIEETRPAYWSVSRF